MTLSAATMSAWAKFDRSNDMSLSLVRHLEDSAGVAQCVWDSWLSPSVRALIGVELPGGERDGAVLLRWLAGVHDIGKMTPAFAVQVDKLADRMHAHGLRCTPLVGERKLLPHALAGQVVLDEYLTSQHGWSTASAQTYSTVVGGHHGVPPTRNESRQGSLQQGLLGTARWRECRAELLEYVTVTTGADERLAEWANHPLSAPVQALLTAAVIVSDWIASNQELFPLNELRDSGQFASDVWRDLGLPPPWRPTGETVDEDLLRTRFDLPVGATARPIQERAAALARELPEPGLLIVEAAMGEGKTEAALVAAEILAERFGLGGVFVALPTMATSDAMFDRVLQWVDRLPADRAGQSMFLAHGKAALNESYGALVRARYVSVGDDADGCSGVTAHSWLAGRKKGPLSNFVVGTIDQVLMAALKVRHLALRHLALANKVVIVDEVHAADKYMSTYLCRCLEWLGAYRVPVILLSATLPAAQRRSLVEAYRSGTAAENVDCAAVEADIGYPSIVCSSGSALDIYAVPASGRTRQIRLDRIDDELDTLCTVLETALVDGGCVGVVCNTVGRAQETFAALRGSFDENEIVLLHSRFVSIDRMRIEKKLRATLGPPESSRRPGRLVVVGTQVIEQSLDIDFDLMVTDLAPVDLMLQRMGRLHRHERSDRPRAVSTPRCVIRGVDWTGSPPEPVPGSIAVYAAAPLLRTEIVIAERWDGGIVNIPADIPLLVQRAYRSDIDVPADWAQVFADAETGWRDALRAQAEKASKYLLTSPAARKSLRGWIESRADDAEGVGGAAQVRDTEESIEAIVVQKIGNEVRALSGMPHHGGALLPTDAAPPSYVAKALAGCTIRLPTQLTKYGNEKATIDTLEKAYYPGWQQSNWLEGQLVLELDGAMMAEIAGFRLEYDQILGLTMTRIEDGR